MKKLPLTIAILFGLFSALSFAQPQSGKGQGMNGFGPEPNFIEKKLHLNDTQAEEFQNLMTNMRKESIKIHSQLELKKLDVETTLRSKDFSPETLMTLSDDLDNLQNKLRKTRLTFWTDVYNILDDNQKEMWKKGFLKFMRNAERDREMGMREMKEKRMQMMRKENRMQMMKGEEF